MRRRRRGSHGEAGALQLPDPGRVVAASLGDHSWTTRVEDTGARRLQVLAPVRRLGDVILPEPGTPVSIAWPTPQGRMVAEGVVAEAGVEDDDIACWRIDVARVARQQRRRSFRLEVALPLTLTWGEEQVSTRTRDLSEHGVGCVVPFGPSPGEGEVVEVALELPGADPPADGEWVDSRLVTATAQVARTEAVDAGGGPPRLVALGLAFVDEDEEREAILRRFVLEEQLRLRASARS